MRIYAAILCKKDKDFQASKTHDPQGPNNAVSIKQKKITNKFKSKFSSFILGKYRKQKRELKIDQEEEKVQNKEWPGKNSAFTSIASSRRDLASDDRLMNSPQLSSLKWSDYIESKPLMQLFVTNYRI